MLDHLKCQCADYAKEAAYYQALMNWKVRFDDGRQAVLDIGDWGGLVLRGGYVAPPPPANAPAPPAGAPPRAPRRAAFDGMAWGIDNWDRAKVEAALKARGLNPVADHVPAEGFESFHVKDPDGFDVQVCNSNRKNRRQKPAAGKATAPAPFESTAWTTVYLDHISFEVTNYKETAAFYHALLGWKLGDDEGSQHSMDIGELGGIIIRRSQRPGQPPPTARRASTGHISFGIASFDPDKVKEELTKRPVHTKGWPEPIRPAFYAIASATARGTVTSLRRTLRGVKPVRQVAGCEQVIRVRRVGGVRRVRVRLALQGREPPVIVSDEQAR